MTALMKCGAVFLDIPGTGGDWVSSVLDQGGLLDRRPPWPPHADQARALNYSRYGGDFHLARYLLKRRAEKVLRPLGLKRWSRDATFDAFTFCFVRHPVGWYEARWRSFHGRGRSAEGGGTADVTRWDPEALIADCFVDDFNDSVRRILARWPGFLSDLYERYATPRSNCVGKYETLVDDLVSILQQLNVNFDEQWVREFPLKEPEDTPLVWEPELREALEIMEYRSLFRFGYCSRPEEVREGSAP